MCLKNKGDKITRKITWWRLKNPAQVVEHWINRDISDLCFHSSQDPHKIQLILTGDHFGDTYGLYIARANTLEPNSPSNFLPLACISNSNDTGPIIFDIIEPIIENLSSLEKLKLDFSDFGDIPRAPSPHYHEWDNIPVHKFGSTTDFRAPENVLCYQPGELKEMPHSKKLHVCKICSRKFDSPETLTVHENIDHENQAERKKISVLHPDFNFYAFQKGDKIPKNKFLSAFDALILSPK